MKFLFLFLASGMVVAQSVQTPIRDVRKEPIGTGVIAGVVREAAEGKRPLRRATVRLSGDQLLTARQAPTRDDGTFSFENLPPGQYNLTAGKNTYMSAEYGARRPGGSGSAIALAAGQRVTDLVFSLSRYGEISGTIFDQDGQPAVGISVEALRYTMRTGRRTLSSVYGRPSFTDDRGVYRLGGLTPGEYYVATGPSPEGGWTGGDRGVPDVQRLSASDIDRVMQLLSRPGAEPPSVTFAEPRQVYAPVYYPGFTDFSSAQRIAIALGEERRGVDLRLQLVPAAPIEGTVLRFDGQPATGVQVVATSITEAQSMDLFSPGAVGPAAVDAQGHFSYPAVAPGRYFISARTTAPSGGAPLFATAEVSVSGEPQSVSLTLQPGATISGKVQFDGQSLQPPANLSTIRVSLSNLSSTVSLSPSPATVAADGTFRMTGVPPGQYKVGATAPVNPAGWAARSAMRDSVDLLDLPMTVQGDVENITLTFTDRPTELSGTLQTPVGTPTADCFIIVFASDKSFWTPSTRRNAMARPTSAGRYVIRNLPPGEYFVAAVTDVEQGDWFDIAFLERLVPAATRITLSEAEKRQLDLRIQ
jgi:Carboxypeptidase regulatory-like domain